MNGSHRRAGIIALAGAGIRQTGDVGARAIYDVAPTVLALGGLSLPADLDGKPIVEALAHPVIQGDERVDDALRPRHELDAEDDAAMAERLAALGYLEP